LRPEFIRKHTIETLYRIYRKVESIR